MQNFRASSSIFDLETCVSSLTAHVVDPLLTREPCFKLHRHKRKDRFTSRKSSILICVVDVQSTSRNNICVYNELVPSSSLEDVDLQDRSLISLAPSPRCDETARTDDREKKQYSNASMSSRLRPRGTHQNYRRGTLVCRAHVASSTMQAHPDSNVHPVQPWQYLAWQFRCSR